jgi:Icc-related predicted phosphoesterase
MKCLLVSDLHYTLKQLDWVDRVANDFDVVIMAGDHLDIASAVALEAQIVVMLKYLQRVGSRAQLLVSSGNHDLNARDEHGEKVARWMTRARQLGVLVDGDAIEVAGTLFTVCPWWDGPETQKAVDAQLARDAERIAHMDAVRVDPAGTARVTPTGSGLPKQAWAWVYHAPPSDSPTSWNGTRYYGDDALAAWIRRYRPAMVFAGHIHQSPFRQGGSWIDRIDDTWIFNPGRQIGPVPTHVIVDTDGARAMWFSLAGNEIAPLDVPLVRPLAEIGPDEDVRPAQ